MRMEDMDTDGSLTSLNADEQAFARRTDPACSEAVAGSRYHPRPWTEKDCKCPRDHFVHCDDDIPVGKVGRFSPTDFGDRHCACERMPFWDVFEPGGARVIDVEQGEASTCYFLAAIVAIAEKHPEVLKTMFIVSEPHTAWPALNYHGPLYLTQWKLDGRAVKVAIDDWIPVVNGEPRFVRYNDGYDFWPLILEKAWAKIFGSFQAVQWGTVGEAFKAVTQAPVDIMRVRQCEQHWLKIQSFSHERFPIYAQSKSKSVYGIRENHGHAVVGVRDHPHREVDLIDPWNENDYNGALKKTGPSGRFTMTWEEFTKAFQYVSVARLQDDYLISTLELVRKRRRTVVQLEFTVKSTAAFSVQLEWPNFRLLQSAGCKRLLPDVSMKVRKKGFADVVAEAKLERWRKRHLMSNIRADIEGGTGTYVIDVEFALNAQDDWLTHFIVNTYAPEEIDIQLVQDSSDTDGNDLLDTADGRQCRAAVNRLNHLDNSDEILSSGTDSQFPPEPQSIVPDSSNCGANCLIRDSRWMRFKDIMDEKTARK